MIVISSITMTAVIVNLFAMLETNEILYQQNQYLVTQNERVQSDIPNIYYDPEIKPLEKEILFRGQIYNYLDSVGYDSKQIHSVLTHLELEKGGDTLSERRGHLAD